MASAHCMAAVDPVQCAFFAPADQGCDRRPAMANGNARLRGFKTTAACGGGPASQRGGTFKSGVTILKTQVASGTAPTTLISLASISGLIQPHGYTAIATNLATIAHRGSAGRC